MKQVISGNGTDTTATVLSALTSGYQFRFADLYQIGDFGDPNAILITNWETDLSWPIVGTFKSSVIPSRKPVAMKIGLEVQTFDFEWAPKLTAYGTSISTANLYQKFALGLYRGTKVRVWRAIMPSAGDANTYGAFELFGGRIGKVIVTRGKIAITVNSFLDCIKESVPPNVIENTNVLAAYTGALPVFADGETVLAQFTVVAPSTTNNIMADCTSPTANKIYSLNKLQFGYIVFNPSSTLAGFFAMIVTNSDFNAGGGVHHNEFITYETFPWAPTPGDTFFVSVQAPVDQSQGTIGTNNFPFPYVPSPESAV